MAHFNDISADEVREFIAAVEEALGQRASEEFYLGSIGLAISFDQQFQPFMLTTRGFNREENRVYIRPGVRVLDRIAKLLKEDWFQDQKEPAGGRVFLTPSGVKRIDKYKRQFNICTWDWPTKK